MAEGLKSEICEKCSFPVDEIVKKCYSDITGVVKIVEKSFDLKRLLGVYDKMLKEGFLPLYEHQCFTKKSSIAYLYFVKKI